jgi:sulfane dehydrogenase subunit SoxC
LRARENQLYTLKTPTAEEAVMPKGIRHPSGDAVAGNGLIDRRALLGQGVAIAGALSTGVGASLTSAAAEPLKDDPWSLEPGSSIKSYELPSRFEKNVARTLNNPDGLPFVQTARTPVCTEN